MNYDPPKVHWLKKAWELDGYHGKVAICGHTRVLYTPDLSQVTCLRCLKGLKHETANIPLHSTNSH